LTVEPSTATLVAVALSMPTAPWMLSTTEVFFTEVSELVSDLLVTRLATVLVELLSTELTSCVDALPLDSIELLLLALFAPKALLEALFEALAEASCSPFDEAELVAKLLVLAEEAARLEFEAEFSDAAALRALPEELDSLADLLLLALVAKLSLAPRLEFEAEFSAAAAFRALPEELALLAALLLLALVEKLSLAPRAEFEAEFFEAPAFRALPEALALLLALLALSAVEADLLAESEALPANEPFEAEAELELEEEASFAAALKPAPLLRVEPCP
jgi:hypothetical protein